MGGRKASIGSVNVRALCCSCQRELQRLGTGLYAHGHWGLGLADSLYFGLHRCTSNTFRTWTGYLIICWTASVYVQHNQDFDWLIDYIMDCVGQPPAYSGIGLGKWSYFALRRSASNNFRDLLAIIRENYCAWGSETATRSETLFGKIRSARGKMLRYDASGCAHFGIPQSIKCT